MCDPGSWRGRYRGSRPRTPHPIDTVIKPIFGRTTGFSLPHAALAMGLLDPPPCDRPLSWQALIEAARAKWGSSAERFLTDVHEIYGKKCRKTYGFIQDLPAAIIGRFHSKGIQAPHKHITLCPDLRLTLAFLSHRAGDFFLRSREPDYSWRNLFGGMFEVDEPVEPARLLDEPPWSRFCWEPRPGGRP